MNPRRPQRAQSVIQEELNKLILKEIDFPLGALVTVSDVAVSSDMEHVKVGISVIPDTSDNEVMKILDASRGRLQHLLNKKLNIRPMPKIQFERDFGLGKAANIERLLLDQ
ncbi:MAG: 30S ribosome-binding factor RbfA [Candidatus Colwellbacteria bacterium]|nr:30S ribosome-binding factor RbfA [Candidatus Colwellbacteria bacterium]